MAEPTAPPVTVHAHEKRHAGSVWQGIYGSDEAGAALVTDRSGPFEAVHFQNATGTQR